MSLLSTSRTQSRFRNIFDDNRVGYAIGAICLMVVIGILAWLATPAPQVAVKQLPPDPFQDPAKGMEHIRKLAATYGTDFDRLSNDDRLFLNSIAMGHGRELLAKTVRELKSSPTKPNAKP